MPTVGPMDDRHPAEDDPPLSVQLDVYLDRQPVTGRLRAAWGADERFVGWLGFVDALKRLHEHREAPAGSAGEQRTPGLAADDNVRDNR